MKKPKIKIELVERMGKYGCHRGHKVGEIYDFDEDRGKLCPMAMHVLFPYINILRY
ncbi:TIGR04076 family protein, partial [Synergistaceae bacterium OttesenSCG-928-I11]|nr:TIGR04076 family protein [Synergistaceae bacterium OttesenSCG-928-I11]